MLREPLTATVDDEGRLVLPADVANRLGLLPGATATLDQDGDSVRVRRPVEHLAKVYVEPTTRCNLRCRTCVRRSWEGSFGDMSEETFARLLAGLEAFDPLPDIFFGGFGEPLAHPRILEMVERVKALGVPRVELITNGCLLDQGTSCSLIEAGLDTLWVSLDGIRPESYSDVRLGALLPQVLENLKSFKQARRERQFAAMSPEERTMFSSGMRALRPSWYLPEPRPVLGVVFVAMKRNIDDLPALIDSTYRLGARRFIVSNVLPYTADLAKEMLCHDRLRISPFPTLWSDRLRIPLMDIRDESRLPLYAAVHSFESGLAESDVSNVTRRCPFIEAGTTAVTWQGKISPCLALMHEHDEVFYDQRRHVEAYAVGDVVRSSLEKIWTNPEYVAFRRRVQGFEFAPCIVCRRCDLPLENKEDCQEETFPVCGACLWSQGLIQCP
jgi:MoaA/NifB/PqqE/SkfB family radical SAM enzyme